MLGGLVGTPAVVRAVKSWYAFLPKPHWCPPDGVFAPVWTVLYASMGYSAFLVKRSAGLGSWPVQLFLAHYLLNLSWAPLSSAGEASRRAGAERGATGVPRGGHAGLRARRRPRARLLVPYLAWLAFATVLNAEICRLNPAGSSALLRGKGAAGVRGGGVAGGAAAEDKWTPKQSLSLIGTPGGASSRAERRRASSGSSRMPPPNKKIANCS